MNKVKYTLVKAGDLKALFVGGEKVATWDKHDSYELCLKQIGQRKRPEDPLSEVEMDAIPDSIEENSRVKNDSYTAKETVLEASKETP